MPSSLRRPHALAVGGVLALALTACGGGDDPLAAETTTGSADSATVVIGSADFPESQLIGAIYAAALEAQGIATSQTPNIGSREVYVPALQDGSVDVVPEYSGAMLQYLDPETTATTEEEVGAALTAALPEGITALEPSEAEDKDSLAVTAATAEQYGLATISDLVPVAGELGLGGPPEWQTRTNGVPGLRDVYGLEFKEFVALDAGGPLTLNALTTGQVQVADLFSTDPAIATEDLVVLEDDKTLFLPENILPLVRDDALDDDVRAALDAVSAALTTEDLVELNGRIAQQEDIDDIAADWLAQAGLS